MNKLEGFVLISPGEFRMGSPDREYGRGSDEAQHLVKISHPFWISKFELTNREWNKYKEEELKKGAPIFYLSDSQIDEISTTIGRPGGHYALMRYGESNQENLYLIESEKVADNWQMVKKGKSFEVKNSSLPTFDHLVEKMDLLKCRKVGRLNESHPVTHVSYSQVSSFCWELTSRWRREELLPKALVVRLPTEAEWEYACRSGNAGFCGLADGFWLCGENANIDGSSQNYILDERPSRTPFVPLNRGSIHQIDPLSPRYPPNNWGIHDMHGNVMEWCYDFYGEYEQGDLTIDPVGPIYGTQRVVRGGSFYRTAQQCRSASRSSYESSYRGSEIGFRLAIGYPVR